MIDRLSLHSSQLPVSYPLRSGKKIGVVRGRTALLLITRCCSLLTANWIRLALLTNGAKSAIKYALASIFENMITMFFHPAPPSINRTLYVPRH